MFFAKTTISAALVAAVNGHMMMKTPAPFDPDHLNNSPLDAGGADFPCKIASGVYAATGGTVNEYELGSSQPLTFIGSAVHGGGSCQVVMTYDNPPTADSKWKVIHSIEGGCPAKGQAGNLPENSNGDGAGKYTFKVPSDIPTGKGTIGWTWFNRIGNREMYMNCGALSLTGTGGDQSNFDKLPDMVVLNIGSHPKTPEGVDYKFTEPGPSVENNIGQFGVATCSNDGCVAGDQGGSDSGSGSSSGGSATTSAAPASTTTQAGNGGGVFLTVGTPSSSATPTSSAVASTPATTTPSAAPAPTPTPSSGSGSGAGAGAGSAGAASGACTSEGMWNCISGTSFQQCASGLWSAVQPMAAGTKCTPGQSMDLGMIAAGRRVRAFRA